MNAITIIFFIGVVIAVLAGIQWGLESNRRDKLVRQQLRERKRKP